VKRWSQVAGAAAAIAALAGAAAAAAPGAAPRSTLGERIVPTGPPGPYQRLTDAPGERYVAREGGIGRAQSGRSRRRRSLIYFGQLSDFQISDEESPARVEFLDPFTDPAPFDAAWRPWEAMLLQTADAGVHAVNEWVNGSPVRDSRGRRARMAFALTTGDSVDSQQRNETQWVVRLLEGGVLDPNSGSTNPSDYAACPPGTPGVAEARKYTGVQDYDDYSEGPDPFFYDPDDPRGTGFSAWPRYPGLMDKAEQPFFAEGLRVPSYVVFGNHDGLVQGNQSANGGFEAVATGCIKPTSPLTDPRDLAGTLQHLTPGTLLSFVGDPSKVMLVPPDPRRQFVSKAQYKALHATHRQRDAHGFGLVDRAQLAASNGAAGYYSWSPRRGIRFIGLDTVSEGGVTGPSADGNIDDPQFRWLQGELKRATRRDELVILFSHHAIASLTADVPDESAAPCTGQQRPPPDAGTGGHDRNPGCDVDPRDSRPIHLGADVTSLVHSYPHVVAWIAGHSHRNSIEPLTKAGGGGFWSIRLAAEADWPQQQRLVDVMDNRDGTLSVFGTIIDHASPAATPPAGTPAAGLGTFQLASLARTMSYNDLQVGSNPFRGGKHGEGTRGDRNVELLVGDPRRNPLEPGGRRRCASIRGRIAGKRLHRARLGRKRRTIRRAYPSRRTRGSFDYFCLADGRAIGVGYPSRRLRRGLGRRERRRTRGRAVLILTTSRHLRVRAARVGTRTRILRRRLHRERRYRVGRNIWYLARGKRSTLVFKTRAGRVRSLGIADRRLTRTRRGQRRFLRGFFRR
jgi:hypothetical protein